ncbi:MAG: oligosaccharide flippase family protein [Arcobacteraceae bacterium]|jgi:O-antigen/teichoic acid export membrane protein|nr:oligosaccharide flippase family protein [Arcobacteraceae bacterium]
MINRLKPKSEFSRNILTLMTGTTIAQAIPIAISPILTRIYTPEDFGVLALFISISAIFGSIANGRYELAIMLPKKDEDAINIFALGFIITCFISFILLVFVILFNEYFTRLLGNNEISFWLYFVPLSVFCIGIWNILNYFNNRKKYYKDIAKATIIKSIVLSIIQLCIGFIKDGSSGLILGEVISRMFANIRLLNNIIKNKIFVFRVSTIKIIALAKRYKDFPKFSMFAILANALSGHFINLLISIYYSITILGFYSFTERILGAPTALIGKSISQVFFQQATIEKQSTGKAINTFNNTIKKLIILALPLFGTLFLIVEDLFTFIFGEAWRIAGIYAQIIMPLFFIRFIISSVSAIDTIMERQKIYLVFNLCLLCMSILVIIIFKEDPFETFLRWFSLSMGFIYLVYGYVLFKMAKDELNFGVK